MDDAIAALENASMEYGTGRRTVRALGGLSCEVRSGEVLRLIGASGSGKTTALWVLGLMLTPTGGRVTLFGEDVTRASTERRAQIRRQRIGFVFQAFHLIPYLTALDNVALGLGDIGGAMRGLAGDALDRVGLASAARALPSELSGGEQQRVAIARAFAKKPSLLLADEPTGNLDDENATAVATLLGEAAADGVAVVVATHDVGLFGPTHPTVRLHGGQALSEPAIESVPQIAGE